MPCDYGWSVLQIILHVGLWQGRHVVNIYCGEEEEEGGEERKGGRPTGCGTRTDRVKKYGYLPDRNQGRLSHARGTEEVG